MLRATLRRNVKLVVVESPNKVASVTSYAGKIPDLGFGDATLSAMRDPALADGAPEPILVVATVGHFKRLDAINHTQNAALPPPADVPAAVASATPSDDNTACALEPSGHFAFDVTYKVDDEKRNKHAEIVGHVRALGGKLSEVIIATDPDREGEIIGEHALATVLEAAGHKRKNVTAKQSKANGGEDLTGVVGSGAPALNFSRAYIQSITPEGVEAALRDRRPNWYDVRLARAAMSRSVLDRMFGYFGSAMVQTVSAKLKSIGRVQTPALILIDRRERAHDEFLRTRATTFGITARGTVGDGVAETGCSVVLYQPGAAPAAPAAGATKKRGTKKTAKGKKASAADVSAEEDGASTGIDTWSPTTLDGAKAVASLLEAATGGASPLPWSAVFASASPAQRAVEPPQPLTLQALMLRMGKKLRMGSEEVMSACQRLFTDGLITYPRTDSVRIEPAPAKAIKAYVAARFGVDAVAADDAIAQRLSGERPKKGKKGTTKAANVEDAHEALRPTNIAASAPLGTDARIAAVYDEIRAVTLQAFMPAQRLESLSCTFTTTLTEAARAAVPEGVDSDLLPPAGTSVSCRVSATRTVDAGFTAAVTDASGEGDESPLFAYLLKFAKTPTASAVFSLAQLKAVERRSPPPPLYFEGALIEELKQQGIGRPSTYATILPTLRRRGYVEIDDTTGKIRTTAHGRALVGVAQRFFPLFVDLGFTAQMEGSLDGIVHGTGTSDALLSAVHVRLLSAATEVARSSYFKDAEERRSNAPKLELVKNRVQPFSAQAVGQSMAHSDACNRVRQYLRRNMKPVKLDE
jgi:DNA topoisomerase IA